jgi:peptide/nickel transport system substrate-binding protein
MKTRSTLPSPRRERRRRRTQRATTRVATLVLWGALCAVGASACGNTAKAGSAGSQSKGDLTIGINGPPVNLNPAKDGINYASIVRTLADATITHVNSDGTIGPGLALSFRYVDADHRIFQFTLRSDARFSDGSPVTPAAVKAWLEYYLHVGGPAVGDIGQVRSISTLGTRTVEIQMVKPNPILPRMLSELYTWGQVQGPKALANPAILATNTDGAGPYKLDPGASVTGDHYTFVPNPYYYSHSVVRYSQITVKVITDPSSMLAAVRTGEVNVAMGDPSTAAAASSAGFSVISAPDAWSGLLLTNRASGPLAKLAVRQALNYAINRDQITQALVQKYGTPSSEVATPDAINPQYVNYYAYDPSKARALLTQAGYSHGFTLKVSEGTFFGFAGTPLTQAIAQNFQAIGVRLDITSEPTLGGLGKDLFSGTYPAFVAYYSFQPMWFFYADTLAPKALWNTGHADEPTLDALYQQAAASNSLKLWQQMSALTVTQADFVPVVESDQIYYIGKGVGGVNISPGDPYPIPSQWTPQ